MKEKIIITILVILSIFGIVVIFLLLSNKNTNPPQTLTDEYQLIIDDYNNTLYATLFKDNKSTTLDSSTLPKYALVSFNGPRDIMYTQCIKPYNLRTATSTTANQISLDPVTGASIDITPSQKNNITLNCNNPK